jgi:O-antigen/teichoic acid export membrane protein
MGLKEETIHGTKWEIGSSLLGQFIQLFVTAIVARILAPRDFGVYGMALVFITFLQMFSQLGMGSALIQKKDITEEHLSSIFWLNVITGIALCLIYVACAPLIARFFHEPILKNIVYLLSINFIVVSLTIVQSTMLSREMKFKKNALINLSSGFLAGLVAVLLAVNNFGVWSLVWSLLSQFIAMAFMLWLTSSWRPKFIFNIARIKEVLSFSLNVLSSNILNYFSRNIQDILIGRFINPTAFGYYSMANRIMLLPLQHVTWRVANVVFPAFSKIQSDLPAVRAAYLKTLFFISVITFPLMLGLIGTAPELVLTIVGPNWKPVITLIQILAIAGLLQSIGSTPGLIMLSQGRSDLQLKTVFAGVIVICIAISIGLRWGINGVAVLYTLSMFIVIPMVFGIAMYLIKLSAKSLLAALMPATVSSLIMLGILFGFKDLMTKAFHLQSAVLLICCIIVGPATYAAALYLIFKKSFFEIVDVVKIIMPSFKRA